MILVFGGTTEGRMAAQTLDAAGTPFYYSTKGELQQVEMYNGERLCGAMDTVQLVHFCKENEIRLIIDAAHPFAQGVHGTIYSASRELGIKVVRYERNFNLFVGKKSEVAVGLPEGEIIWCGSYEEAVERLQQDGIVNLLALTGVNTIPKLKGYWSKEENLCHFRVLDRDESRELAE
ncbi:MAG: precorrin-6A/cobalt-precorrin-6A reductase, partial [Bacteroidales bacterium]|nr:precorrin-6A/cobalt-precorrin-6A reductase [Bacteroidales bacterium]